MDYKLDENHIINIELASIHSADFKVNTFDGNVQVISSPKVRVIEQSKSSLIEFPFDKAYLLRSSFLLCEKFHWLNGDM